VCSDQALADRLAPVVPVPVEILPVGYPADLFYPCAPFQEASERLLLYHGACRPQRRLERLIEVIARLPRRYRLRIIGGGSVADEAYRGELAKLADRIGCGDRVDLTNMPQSRIREVVEGSYLCLSYVPVINCFQDQFVLKTFEYLACHRPVLTTATRYNVGLQRRIGRERLLLALDTVEDLTTSILNADGFIRAFHEPANLGMLSAVIAPYSSATVVEQCLVPMYERLLASN
jgi:glycosyltransferase involved in cell wall biosynthesis